jgi:GNAT superfamily N-acetyltransferase
VIEYRKATIDDIEELLQVRIDFLYDTKDITTDEEERIIRDAYADYLGEVLTNGSFVQWLAIENGKIIATSSVSFNRLPPRKLLPSGNTAYIANMYTSPAYRSQGIASGLLALSVEEAKINACDYVSLHATNMGRPVYEKFGFTDTKDEMIYRVINSRNV